MSDIRVSLPDVDISVSSNSINTALSSIRKFEEEQMSYMFNKCSICNELKLDIKIGKEGMCKRCQKDKSTIKMFSKENIMDPGAVPIELMNLSVIEQQLICRIAPTISIHLLKHGGIAANGHCVTFPQEVNEPAQILPKLPKEIKIIRVRKRGANDTSKEFNVRRFSVQHALEWLKQNNPAYSDIIISAERLGLLPINGELRDLETIEYEPNTVHTNDQGPATEHTDPGDVELETVSCVNLPDVSVDIQKQVENVVNEVVGDDHGKVTAKGNNITIPWPTRQNEPISEFSTNHFFTLAFPTLFPFGTGDYRMNRPRTCESMADWANHLLWYKESTRQ